MTTISNIHGNHTTIIVINAPTADRHGVPSRPAGNDGSDGNDGSRPRVFHAGAGDMGGGGRASGVRIPGCPCTECGGADTDLEVDADAVEGRGNDLDNGDRESNADTLFHDARMGSVDAATLDAHNLAAAIAESRRQQDLDAAMRELAYRQLAYDSWSRFITPNGKALFLARLQRDVAAENEALRQVQRQQRQQRDEQRAANYQQHLVQSDRYICSCDNVHCVKKYLLKRR